MIRDCLIEFIDEYDSYADLVRRHESWFQEDSRFKPADLDHHFKCRRATLDDTAQVKEAAERVVATSSVLEYNAAMNEFYEVVKAVGEIDRWA